MLSTQDLKVKLETLAKLYEVSMPTDVCGYSVDEWLKYVAMPRIERDVAQALEAHATHTDFLMEEDYVMDTELAIAEHILEEALYA